MNRDEIRARLADVEQQLRRIHNRAGDRSLSEAEQTRWDRLTVERDDLAEQLEQLDTAEREGLRAAMAAALTGGGQLPGGGTLRTESGAIGGSEPARGPQVMRRVDPWQPEADVRATSRELRGLARAALERSTGLPDAARERVERALIPAQRTDVQADDDLLARYVVRTSDPQYLAAFARWMSDPVSGHHEWSPEERQAARAVRDLTRSMTIGTTTAGGFLAPFQLDPQILISGTGSVDPMRAVARVEIVASNDARFITSAGVTASWDAELAEVSDDTPTLANPAITAFKGQAFVPVSFEIYEDVPNLAQQVGALFVDAKAQLESTAFTTGTGSGQPKGVITAVAAVGGSVVTSAGSALAVADITANQNALPARWRPRARWMANLSIINQGRVLPLYSNGPAAVSDATTPPRMLGWEVLENSAMDGTIAAGSTHDYCLLSGDFASGYIIVDRVGTMVEFVPNLFGASGRPTGSRGFLMHWRSGGDAVITDAFRLTDYSG